jgi:hypothetical protein
MTKICDGCWKWAEFKKDCKFYWRNKHVCTQWQSAPDSPKEHAGREIVGLYL